MNDYKKIAITIHQRHCLERVHNEDCMFWQEDHESALALIAVGVTCKEPS